MPRYRKVIFTCVALSIFCGAQLLQRAVKVQDDFHAATVDESSVVGSRENGGEAWEEWMRNKEIQMKARLARVKEVCAKYDSEERWKEVEQGKSFWFDVEHGLAFCTHAKAGSSSWKRNLLIMSNLPPSLKTKLDHQKTLSSAKKYFGVDGQDQPGFNVDNFSKKHRLLKFSFVRHPFDRVISTYEDKVLIKPLLKFKIRLEMSYNDTSFSSFVRLVLEDAKRFNCQPISRCNIDRHIRPYLPNCLYCDINFDFIGKLEDFDEDVTYIAKMQNLTQHLRVLNHVQNSNSKKGDGSREEKMKKYMSQLTPELVRDLYELYKIDFEMFGYN